jgi:hypothetical protein
MFVLIVRNVLENANILWYFGFFLTRGSKACMLSKNDRGDEREEIIGIINVRFEVLPQLYPIIAFPTNQVLPQLNPIITFPINNSITYPIN